MGFGDIRVARSRHSVARHAALAPLHFWLPHFADDRPARSRQIDARQTNSHDHATAHARRVSRGAEHSLRRRPWAPPAEPPLPFAFTTHLLLPNGETTHGVWAGAIWWRSHGLPRFHQAPRTGGAVDYPRFLVYLPPEPASGLGEAPRQERARAGTNSFLEADRYYIICVLLINWWRWRELNPRPPGLHALRLPV